MKSNGKLYWYGGGSDPLDETDLAGNTSNATFKEYVFFNGTRIASRDSSNNVDYYFADHLGSARVVANAGGTILDDSDFYPFGVERPAVGGTSGNNYKFTSQERDPESYLDNFGARYFASPLGRFMSADPAGNFVADASNPQTWNLYSYVLNNPLNFIDPTGLDCAYLNDEGNGVESYDHSSNPEECAANGGNWYEGSGRVSVVQNDSGDTAVVPIQTDSVTVTANAPSESYSDCIKNDANHFSLQHGLQSISGNRFGNGWVSSALLGSSVAGGIDFFQSFGKHDPAAGGKAAASEAFSRGIGPAGVAVAKTIPNVAFSATVAADISVHSATSSTSISLAARLSGMVPIGSLSRAGARIVNGGLTLVGQVKDPYDLSVASFSAVVCGVGR